MEPTARQPAKKTLGFILDVPPLDAVDERGLEHDRQRRRKWTERSKSIVFWSVLAFVTAGVLSPHVVTYAPSTEGITWTLVEADDFDASSLDTSKWGVYSSPGTNGNGTFSPTNILVTNGELQIRGLGDTGGGLAMSKGQTYGRWETRMKLDVGKGYAPAVMLWPDSDVWADGEIDFFETRNGAANTGTVTVHKPGNPTNNSQQLTYDITPNEWHVWAVEWLPSRLTFYVDGLKVYEVTDTAFIPTKPFHFVAQLEIGVPGGTLDIPVRDSFTPQPIVLHIDYVRMYRTDVTIAGAGGGVPRQV